MAHCVKQMNAFGLETIHVPEISKPGNDSKCPIYMSKEFRNITNNKDKTALVLIQGTGAVRAGIWARSVAINDNLEIGSMLPQVEWALSKAMPVIVMNPNYNVDPETGVKIPFNDTMSKHAVHVWQNYIVNAGFDKLLVVAHSAGGMCLEAIQRNFKDTFYDQVHQIAITDSCVIN